MWDGCLCSGQWVTLVSWFSGQWVTQAPLSMGVNEDERSSKSSVSAQSSCWIMHEGCSSLHAVSLEYIICLLGGLAAEYISSSFRQAFFTLFWYSKSALRETCLKHLQKQHEAFADTLLSVLQNDRSSCAPTSSLWNMQSGQLHCTTECFCAAHAERAKCPISGDRDGKPKLILTQLSIFTLPCKDGRAAKLYTIIHFRQCVWNLRTDVRKAISKAAIWMKSHFLQIVWMHLHSLSVFAVYWTQQDSLKWYSCLRCPLCSHNYSAVAWSTKLQMQ